MATITGLTAERMLAIEDASVVDGDVVGGNLILTKHDGSQINAGSVIGPEGPEGPVGSDLDVLTAQELLNIGRANQIRAGRQLSATDFANIGLGAPLGLWNLADLTDVSGNGRNLLNKGSVPFTGVGINGSASTAAVFAGSTGQALYIADTGANDPFRIRTGAFGCWFRTAKRSTVQTLMAKYGASGQFGWILQLKADNKLEFIASVDGTTNGIDCFNPSAFKIAPDNRWHFAVAVYDGYFATLYVDGVAEGAAQLSNFIFGSNSPFNIGGRGADGSTAATNPFLGLIDEAFVTSEVLTADQVKNLYCAKITHALAEVPARVTLNIHRSRRGAALAVADFPTQPLRLYNFTDGALTDQGSNNVTLTANQGTGKIAEIAGVDGTKRNAQSFWGIHTGLSGTTTGLPSGLAARSYGFWYKIKGDGATVRGLFWFGTTPASNDCRVLMDNDDGLKIYSGADHCDILTAQDGGEGATNGYWHFLVVTEDNAAADGIKRKVYLDGILRTTSAVMNSVALGGANYFRLGAIGNTGVNPHLGQLDSVFVCDYILSADDIVKLYEKSSTRLLTKPQKDIEDMILAMTSDALLVKFDLLDSGDQIDLKVAP